MILLRFALATLASAPLATTAVARPMVAPVQPLPAAQAAQAPAATAGTAPYADIADLVLAAPVIADATVRSTTRLKGADAAGVAPGQARLYVEADLSSLIRGRGGLPPRVGYLLDVRPDARGRLPRLKKARVLLFARAATTPGQIQLVGPDAQRAWTPALDEQVRRITQDVVAADAPPAIAGVGNAFHVTGALPGESETQVFLQTADNRPVSLSVLRRPGEQPRWAVALSEIVDEAAGPPQRDTLLWYRLACGLPRELPARSTAALEPQEAVAARADYQFVIAALGPCGRSGDVG